MVSGSPVVRTTRVIESHRFLAVGSVKTRLIFLLDAKLFDIGGDAYDLHPFLWLAFERNALADWRAVREIGARERFVDNRDIRSAFIVVIREKPPLPQGVVYRAKVTGLTTVTKARCVSALDGAECPAIRIGALMNAPAVGAVVTAAAASTPGIVLSESSNTL